MSGGGHMADMFNRFKANKRLIRTRPFLAAKKDYLLAVEGLHITYKEATPQQLEEIRSRFRLRRKKAIERNVFVGILSIFITILLAGIAVQMFR